jgi:hypothetical protein
MPKLSLTACSFIACMRVYARPTDANHLYSYDTEGVSLKAAVMTEQAWAGLQALVVALLLAETSLHR